MDTVSDRHRTRGAFGGMGGGTNFTVEARGVYILFSVHLPPLLPRQAREETRYSAGVRQTSKIEQNTLGTLEVQQYNTRWTRAQRASRGVRGRLAAGWGAAAQVPVAGVGVAGAEGCDHGVQRQLPVSAHSRNPASPHAHEHAPMRARTRTWQRFGGLSLPLPTCLPAPTSLTPSLQPSSAPAWARSRVGLGLGLGLGLALGTVVRVSGQG